MNQPQQLATQHFPMVRSIARTMSRRLPAHISVDELEGMGSVGLVEAAHRFQPERSVEFKAYAAQRIRGAILDALRENSWRGRGVERRGRELVQLEEKLTAELGRSPKSEDFAAAGMPIDELARRRRDSSRAHTASLESEPAHGEGPSAGERLACGDPSPEDRALSGERAQVLKSSMAQLNDRERRVLELYYFEGIPVKGIGSMLGVTEARISQIHTSSLRKLRGCPRLAELGPVA